MALASDLVQIGFNSKQADFLGSTNTQGLSATGTVQGTALALTNTINLVETCAAGVNDGVILPATNSYKGDFVVVQNSGVGTLKVYPASGQFINVLAANTNTTVASGSGKTFYKCNKVNERWITVP